MAAQLHERHAAHEFPRRRAVVACDQAQEGAAAEAWTTWFLPQLPAHVTSVVFNTEDGVENGYTDVDFVLACRDGRDVVDTLTDHLRHVWRAGGTSPPPRADD
ncbi:hypothetical protein ACFRCG_38135 [Embleya sp. NPDC056575]|uniref:hypothetical protein n=1 Tax=unclassified Embleya TaxID=2699296 RepID=UPI003692053C